MTKELQNSLYGCKSKNIQDETFSSWQNSVSVFNLVIIASTLNFSYHIFCKFHCFKMVYAIHNLKGNSNKTLIKTSVFDYIIFVQNFLKGRITPLWQTVCDFVCL